MTPPGLYIRGLARIGHTRIFGPVDLDIMAASWTCLLGASGVGKSTLLRCLAGTADGVVLDGKVGASDGLALTGRVALMAQSDLLMPWLTVLDNVVLGSRLRGEAIDQDRAMAMVAQVGLDGFATRKAGALSGGQRQRVALARTLMEDRPVVLLDEPFSALDVATRARMQELAARMLTGRTVLHVTHDPAEAARLSDHIITLTDHGVHHTAVPASASPRAPDDDKTMAVTATLTRLLLKDAA